MPQEQFLDVVDRDEAHRRFSAAIDLTPLPGEEVPLSEALGRVLRDDVFAEVDVPSFDRSNFDGYAVVAADTAGASEERPRRLRLLRDAATAGVPPRSEVAPGTALTIATGGMLPRGADAVVMVEFTDLDGNDLLVYKPVAPGDGLSYAGSDIMAGELVLRRGEVLSSRETGILAAIGTHRVNVHRRPRVAILSTGDEIIPPGQPLQPGKVFDSNARILADAVRELGGVALELGVVGDDRDALRRAITEALRQADVVLLSGGTSKGGGDLAYRAVAESTRPGILVHGVALKPGKPVCLAAHGTRPVVVLPGFPTSAIFTFHEFVAPLILRLGGRPAEPLATVDARLAVRVNSQIGRTEYVLVSLLGRENQPVAYPMSGGSGSVTAFSRADGFVRIERLEELVEAGTPVSVHILCGRFHPADMVVIGSHCTGLDYLLGQLGDEGWRVKFMAVGSTAGLEAVRRGECDLAGMHLLDEATGQYNRPFLTPEIELIEGYGRLQGVLYRRGDARFEGRTAAEAVACVAGDASCRMINRNAGSGTRILIDRLLQGAKPNGYSVQTRSHNAVAAAIAQGRADWGIAIAPAAARHALGFLPLEHERYDFAVARGHKHRPALAAFRALLQAPAVLAHLAAMGFEAASDSASSGAPRS